MENSFQIKYRISLLNGENIHKKVEDICLEQSVEMPADVLPPDIIERIVGNIISIDEISSKQYNVVIEWPLANIGNEITQFLNILFGNISLKPGILITGVEWEKLDFILKGPGIGLQRFREKWNIHDRAISSTALKPMGFTPQQIGELCFEFATGGIDIIKDDHGLANQPYAPFVERVTACVQAINAAADNTGRRSLYFPNITSSAVQTVRNYQLAAEMGADGVLFAPQLGGLDTLHELARMDIDLPIMAHPSFSGSYVIHHDHGFTPSFYYGEFWRALGADFIIYANAGGRFSFSIDECQLINSSAREDLASFKSAFPTPGGGINRNKLNKWVSLYGEDTVLLIGGSLYQHPGGIRKAAEEIRLLLEK